MARKIFSTVMWVGRTAATAFGLALVLALVFGVATTAIGATGGNFILGKASGATTVSKLTASIAGPALTLVNQSTGAAATALNISVASGKPPIKVNAAAGTATDLSADELDGEDSAAFLPSRIYTVSAFTQIQPGFGNGAVAYCDAGDLAVSGGYRDLNANLDIYSDQRVVENTDPENGPPHPSGWGVSAHSPLNGSPGALDAYAYCADRPPRTPDEVGALFVSL